MRKVNLAIIGCGAITTNRHAPECVASDNIHLQGVFDVNLERAQEVAEQFQCKAYKSYDEVLSDEAVDGVILCVSNKYHCDMTVQALQHKKHVLCEKPMAVTIDEAKKMIAVAKQEGRYLMIAHQQRFVAANQKIKEILTTKDLGKILSFSTIFAGGGPETWSVDKTNKTWFLNKSEAGLGALGDIGIHKADLIRWFIGEDIKYVTSVLKTLDKRDPEGNLIGIEDNGFAILESVNGIVGTLEASWTHYGKSDNRTTFYCEKAVVEANGVSKITIYYKDKTKENELFVVQNGASGMAEAFAECIALDKEPEISGEEGLKALEIVLACVESSQKHARVEI